MVERCREYFAAHERLDAENQVLKRLYFTADGRLAGSAKIDFETYVQRRYFRQVIYEANRRLLTMSGHQFMLKLKETENSGRKSNEGLDLSVYSLVTDSERDIRTLSGGESFLAALAMALGLSDIAIRKAAGLSDILATSIPLHFVVFITILSAGTFVSLLIYVPIPNATFALPLKYLYSLSALSKSRLSLNNRVLFLASICYGFARLVLYDKRC